MTRPSVSTSSRRSSPSATVLKQQRALARKADDAAGRFEIQHLAQVEVGRTHFRSLNQSDCKTIKLIESVGWLPIVTCGRTIQMLVTYSDYWPWLPSCLYGKTTDEARGDDVMVSIRRAEERGRTNWEWLDSRHTFSFGEDLRPREHGTPHAARDQRRPRAAGRRFGAHPHRDMEILSYVLEGALEHRDSLGQRLGDPSRRNSAHARRQRRRAQRIQPVADRPDALPADLDRAGRTGAAAGIRPAPVRPRTRRRAVSCCSASQDGRNEQRRASAGHRPVGHAARRIGLAHLSN